MLGRIYASYPEVLVESFAGMTDEYGEKGAKGQMGGMLKQVLAFYIRCFGIPEMGFQIRGMYFEEMRREIKRKVRRVLDAGSGIGFYALYMGEIYPEAQVVGGDIDRRKLAWCRKVATKLERGNVEFEKWDLTKGRRAKEKFDLIVNIDVLEHIKNCEKVLGNFYRWLLPEGYLFLHVPQPNQRRIFRGSRQWKHKDHVREGIGREKLEEDLRKAGFEIVEMRNTHGFWGSLAWELNHMALGKSLILAGVSFPFLYLLAKLDLAGKNKWGLCTAVLARKRRR